MFDEPAEALEGGFVVGGGAKDVDGSFEGLRGHFGQAVLAVPGDE